MDDPLAWLAKKAARSVIQTSIEGLTHETALPTTLLFLLFRPEIVRDAVDVFIAQHVFPGGHVERRRRSGRIIGGRHPAVADDCEDFIFGVVIRDVK